MSDSTGSLSGRTVRPKVSLVFENPAELRGEWRVWHNGSRTRVVLRRDLISVGCTDVTPEALKYLLEQWEKKFGAANEEVVLQP